MLNSLFKKYTNQDNNDDKPKQVVNGIILLYIAFILSMITDWLDGIGAVPFIVLFLLISFFISSTGQDKKWARIVMLVLIVFNFLSFSTNIAQLLLHSEKGKFTVLVMALYSVEVILEIIALVLLFSKPANAWFNEERVEVE
jgi:cellulose synthase/poly-beta-1,6-N-acetylglucosamine synthase-like glycosyltransferase